MTPNIYFYIPKSSFNADWPKKLTDDWVAFGGGANIWTYFTAIALKESGIPVQITCEIPEKGIVLSHSRYMPEHIKRTRERLLICIRADYGRKHNADIHVVQNSYQINNRGREVLENLFAPGPNYFIPQWPQPGLIPRLPERGDKFENVFFFGAKQNLADFMTKPTWENKLAECGVKFTPIFPRSLWHDYREADATIAIRPKGGDHHSRKPPSKLTNSWLAGVPAILGPDSAFRELRKSSLDYIEVQDESEAFHAITFLKNNPDIRKDMVENGFQRAKEFSFNANLQRWIYFIQDYAIPFYVKRQKQSFIEMEAKKTLATIRGNVKGLF